MANSINVRLLSENDLPALLSIYEHLHAADNPLPPEPDIASVWAEIVADKRIHYFGAYIDADLVSTCNLAVIPNLTRGCRSFGVIENVVTHPMYRRRGFGKAVLGAALDHAWKLGCYKVMLLTGRKDPDIFRFYESAGFDPNGKQAFVARPST